MPEDIRLLLVIFALSMYALMKGADWLIEGATGLARQFRVSELLIGLTIVSFGTSLPELVVSVNAALRGNVILAYSNVVGSNLANMLLIIGCTALILPVVTSREARHDLSFFGLLVLSAAAIVLYGAYPYTNPLKAELSRVGGLILLVFFLGFVVRIVRWRPDELTEGDQEALASLSRKQLAQVISLVLIGMTFIIVGGEYAVNSAVSIAQGLGVSESTIGLTIVAFGTSLPELAASLTAARRQKSDIALGNILGSNIMNLALVMGIAVILVPPSLSHFDVIDMMVHAAVSLVFLSFLLRRRAPSISRRTGALFIFLYLAYLSFVALRA